MPPSIKEFNITSTDVQIDLAAIEWPANATELVYNDGRNTLVCRSQMLGGGAAIRIKCGRNQVIGTSLHSDLRLIGE